MANPNVGRFTWHELASTDVAAAVKFYTSLFDWSVKEMPMGDLGSYHLLSHGDVQVGGAMQAPPGVPSHWLTYIGADDVDRDAKKIEALGGKIIVPPMTIPNMLRFAMADDAQGAGFGIMKGLGEEPLPYDGPPRNGTFVWDELYVPDPSSAMKIYGEVFGWTARADAANEYWHIKRGDKDIGGMMKPFGAMPPHWMGYVGVSDCKASTAKAKSLGAKVFIENKHIDKVGTFSIIQDPSGGVLAPFQSSR